MGDMRDPEIRVWFYEGDADKDAVVTALGHTGLRVVVLPDRPLQRGGMGGGPFLPIDILVQHASGIADGLIATGAWLALARFVNGLRGKYGNVNLNIKTEHEPEPDGPIPGGITVEYSVELKDPYYNPTEMDAIRDDFEQTVRTTVETHSRRNAPDEWFTTSVTIIRRRPLRRD